MNIVGPRCRAWRLVLAGFLAGLWIGTGNASGFDGSSGSAPRRFSLNIGAGLGFLPGRGGDIELLRERTEYVYTSRSPAVQTEFDWDALSSGRDVPLELIIKLTPHFGIGLGTGIFNASLRAAYTMDYQDSWTVGDSRSSEDDHYANIREIKIKLIPARLNLYFFYPLGRLTLYSYGGAGYYLGTLTQTASMNTDFLYLFETAGYSARDQDIADRTVEENARRDAWGLQGGLGAELAVTNRLSLGLEIFGHFLGGGGWHGSSTVDEATTTRSWTSREGWKPDIVARTTSDDRGQLWYLNDVESKDDLYVGNDRSLPLFGSIRIARLDLRALGFRLNLRWHFGRPL